MNSKNLSLSSSVSVTPKRILVTKTSVTSKSLREIEDKFGKDKIAVWAAFDEDRLESYLKMGLKTICADPEIEEEYIKELSEKYGYTMEYIP